MPTERLTGSPERALDGPLLTFDIPTLLMQMKQESTWHKGNRTAMTLLKTRGMRVVLVAMHAGTAIPAHRAEGPITVQAVEGRLTFRAGPSDVTLDPGQLLALQPGIVHGLEAISESAFLLTIASEAPHPAE